MDFKIQVTPEILNYVTRLDHFRGLWAAGTLVPPDRLTRLKEASRIRSVGASSRMSGVRVTDAEVAGLLRGEAPPVREGKEVLGYAEAMDRPFPYDGPLVTPGEIQKLHAVLLGVKENPEAPSAWRTEPLHLEAFDADGRAIGRVFQTLPPRLLAEKMENLTTWLEIELRSGQQHPLLVVAAFMLAFLAASPFSRGNARAGRLLAGHLLRRTGYGYLPYASLEGAMEEMRDAYHDAFDSAETRIWTGEADLSPWIRFFLEAMTRHRERVEAKIDLERRSLDLTPLQRAILDAVREHGTVAASLLMAATGANRNTLKDNLRRLVDRGLIERLGERRGSIYRLASGEKGARGGDPLPVRAGVLDNAPES
jgi:Fic family protein